MTNITALFYKPPQINASFTLYCAQTKTKKKHTKEKRKRVCTPISTGMYSKLTSSWEVGDVKLFHLCLLQFAINCATQFVAYKKAVVFSSFDNDDFI